MATENRRVATYLPKEIDERLQAFKLERGLKGDSQALLTILSEFLGVSSQVAHLSVSAEVELKQRIELLEDRFSQFRNELLGELLVVLDSELPKTNANVDNRISKLETKVDSLEQTRAEAKDELLSELKSELSNEDFLPGQLTLLSDAEPVIELIQSNPRSELLSRLEDSPLQKELKSSPASLSRKAFAERVHLAPGTIGATIHHYHKKLKQPDKLIAWAKQRDPDGIGWFYSEEDKLFHAVSD